MRERDTIPTSAEDLTRALQSLNIEEQVRGLDLAKGLIGHLLQQSVRSLFSSSSRYVVAEQLFSFGRQVIPELETQLLQGGDREAVAYCSLILLRPRLAYRPAWSS